MGWGLDTRISHGLHGLPRAEAGVGFGFRPARVRAGRATFSDRCPSVHLCIGNVRLGSRRSP